MQPFAPIIAAGLFILDIIVLIGDAFTLERKPKSISDFLVLFFYPEASLHYVSRVVLLIVLVICAYVYTVIKFHQRVPMTIMRTVIDIKLSADFREAKFHRIQTVRANLPNVTAFFSSTSPSTLSGYVSDVKMRAYCLGAHLNDVVEIFDAHTRGFESIHSFGRKLRQRWFMLLVPSYFLNNDIENLPKFLRDNLTKRVTSYCYHDEFNGPKPYLDFAAQDYPQHHLKISIHFAGGVPDTLKVRRLTIYGVTDVSFEADDHTVSVYVETLHKERIRISWENAAANNLSIDDKQHEPERDRQL